MKWNDPEVIEKAKKGLALWVKAANETRKRDKEFEKILSQTPFYRIVVKQE